MSKRFVAAGTAYAKALRPQGTLLMGGWEAWAGGYRGGGVIERDWG